MLFLTQGYTSSSLSNSYPKNIDSFQLVNSLVILTSFSVEILPHLSLGAVLELGIPWCLVGPQFRETPCRKSICKLTFQIPLLSAMRLTQQ